MARSPSLIGSPDEWALDLALAAGAGAFLGLIGPFGTYESAPAEVRIPYWIANLCLGYAVISVFARASMRWADRVRAPRAAALLLGVGLGALPITVLVTFISEALLGPHLSREPWLKRYGECLAISEPCAFAFTYLRLKSEASSPASGAAPPRDVPRTEPLPDGEVAAPALSGGVLERLPRRLGRDLLYLEMEDHYVRAHTARGSDLVLMPMRDAVAGLKEIEGLQVHRSYWVARTAVTGAVRDGRNLFLTLATGARVPVSRAFVGRLKSAGWIASSLARSQEDVSGDA